MKRVVALVLLMLLFSAALCVADTYRIERIKILGQSMVEKDELLELLGIRPPTEASLEEIDNGIKRIFRKGLFDDIRVDYTEEKALLIITLKQKRFIHSIRIKGTEKLSKSEVLKVISLKEDTPFDPLKLKKEELKVQRYIKTRGFPEATVKTEVKSLDNGWVDVYFHISEGKPLLIKTITVRGYSQMIKNEMEIQAGDIYDLEEIKGEIEHLKRYFRKKGYINTVVGPVTFYNGELIINIDPGEKLQLLFKGNREFDDDELQEISGLRQLQRIDAESVEVASKEIIKEYKKRGYLDIQVAPVVEEISEGKRVTFFIYEGKRYRLGKLQFLNTSIKAERFKEIMNLKEGDIFNPETLESDLSRVISFYNSLGYLDAKVQQRQIKKDSENGTVTVKVTVKEGKLYRVGSINIVGNSFFKKERILKYLSFKKGDPFNAVELLNSRLRILDEYKRDGFSDARVSVKSSIKDSTVDVVINVREGRRYKLGKIIVRGNLRTRRVVILRELELKEGEPLDFKALSEIPRRLYRLGLFSNVDVKTIESGRDIKDLIIEVREAPHGMLEYGFGYGEYEGLRLFADFTYNNLSGMNRKIRFRLEGSHLKKRFLANIHEPYWIFKDTTLNGAVQYIEQERKDFDTGDILYKVRKYSAEALVDKKLTRNIKAFVAYNYSLVKTYDVKPDVILSKEDTGTLGISSIRPGFIYDSRDHPFEPRHGMVVGMSLKLSTRYLLSESDFYKLSVSTSYYRGLNKWLTLAVSLRGGLAEGFGDTKELPIVERFYLGGRNTVRGFPQDGLGPKGADNSPTGGNAFIVGNLEFRIKPWKSLGFVLFLDSGNVWERIKDVDLDMRYTAGIGLRYSTPVGPVRIDYGHKLDRKEGESSGEIHFSIGHAF